VRIPKESVNASFKIFRIVQGQEVFITETWLTQAWQDGLYYFDMPSFRKSGVYRFQFSCENIPEYVMRD